MSNYISKISDYINWLDNECKNDLIKCFNDTIKPEIKVDTKWYDELQIYVVCVTINEEEKISIDISCGDNYFKGDILDIITEENKFTFIGYYDYGDMDE